MLISLHCLRHCCCRINIRCLKYTLSALFSFQICTLLNGFRSSGVKSFFTPLKHHRSEPWTRFITRGRVGCYRPPPGVTVRLVVNDPNPSLSTTPCSWNLDYIIFIALFRIFSQGVRWGNHTISQFCFFKLNVSETFGEVWRTFLTPAPLFRPKH